MRQLLEKQADKRANIENDLYAMFISREFLTTVSRDGCYKIAGPMHAPLVEVTAFSAIFRGNPTDETVLTWLSARNLITGGLMCDFWVTKND